MKIKKILYYLISYSPLPYLVYFFVRIRFPKKVVTGIIRYYFVNKLKVNIAEAELPLSDYRTILQFFTRRLKSGARKIVINHKKVLSPVDARIMSHGKIDFGKMVQIKNINYSLGEMVGNKTAKMYDGGDYITLYLSPRDYHCIHHPIGGNVTKVDFCQGRLLPVNLFSLENFKEVFSRNRRLIVEYTDNQMSCLSCWVGALNVGRMSIFFKEDFYKQAGFVDIDGRMVQSMKTNIPIDQGAEAGAFELGSTVILIFPPRKIKWLPEVKDGRFVNVGETLAEISA